MKRRLLSIFLTFAMILLMLPNVSVTSALADDMPWKGSGTESEPYLISSREEFEAIADAVNNGNDLLGLYFLQTDDIDLGDKVWPTVGITIDNAAHPFRGVFDGGDKKIYNLCVARPDDDAGLFGYVGEDGVIRNVHVEDGDVSGTYWVGGIAGRNNGIVEYCSFSGYVYGNQQYIGGIVGDNHGGTVRYCYNLGDVEFNLIGGGVVGRNSGGTVENCYNRGYVYSFNIVRGYAGGVVGENTAGSTVENCYSDGWVESVGNMACGAIVGANGDGSTVENCYYPEEFEEDGLSGVGSGSGTIENVTPKSKEQFDSGEVAWELSQGKNGGGWGQTLNDDDGNHDEHPHFTDAPDKEYTTTPIYRVYFTANDHDLLPPDGFMAVYVDPGEKVDAPPLPPGAAWYVKDGYNGEEFDGANIQCNIDAFAGKRILFAGEDGTIEHRITYSTEEQTVDLDLYMKYAEGGPYSEGRFEYTLTEDADSINAQISDDRKTLIIPAGTRVTDSGYTLKLTAHEKEPFIMPLALGQFGTDDVELTVHIMIEKATPEITVKPSASDINYGTALSGSTLSGGNAVHPTARTDVDGDFDWDDLTIVPNVNEAAITGYYVTFKPFDTDNYNAVTIMITLTVKKVAPTNVTAPTPIDSIYNGMAEYLIDADNKGSAEGGTVKYWLSPLDDPNVEPPADNSEYSSTIPSRANVGRYKIWYKVIGDENHNDTAPLPLTAEIKPFPLTISEHVTYNGGDTFTLALEGVTADSAVIAYVKTSDKNAGSYAYSDTEGTGKFTAKLSNSNYVIDENAANLLVIEQLPVVLKWKGPLTFVEDGNTYSVKAEVTNGIADDTINLKYTDNSGSAATSYTARVTDTGNSNYTADPDKGAQNVTQPWRIFEDSKNITLTAEPNCTAEENAIIYGDPLKLKAEIITPVDGRNTVQFYVNNVEVGDPVIIEQINGKSIAACTISDATAKNNFSLGANVIRVDYKIGGGDGEVQVHAMTVFVDPKPLNVKFGNTEKVYDGNNVAAGLKLEPLGVENEDDVTITADNYTYDDPNAADNKTITAHNVTLSGAQSGNYTVDGELKISGRITPKAVKLEWRGATGLVYTGDPVNVNATATETLPNEECAVEVKDGIKVEAGDYTATATGVTNSNYKLPDDNITKDYTIEKANLYIPGNTLPFNGTNKFTAKADGVTPSNENSAEQVDVEMTASSSNAEDYIYSADGTGESIYTASTTNPNYLIAGGAILTIEKVDPIYTAPVPTRRTFNNQPQDLVTEGTVKGGEMQYSLTRDGTYYTTVPTGIDAGTYTVWYRVLGDNNHNDIEPRSVEAMILLEDDNEYVPGWPNMPSGGSTDNNPNNPNVSDNDPSSDPSDPDASGGDPSNDPNSPNISDSVSSDDPNDSAAPDSDTTNKPDSSSDHNDVPNTGIEINYALYFVILCLCVSLITGVFRKVR